MVLGDLSSIAGLNKTVITEIAPAEYNLLIGFIFLFIGIAYIMWTYIQNKKQKGKLKRW